MDWVSEHLQLIIAIAGAVAWWLNQRNRPEAGPEGPDLEKGFEDPDLAERTRRIREEIQRKIEQRSRGSAQPEMNAPSEPPKLPPVMREAVRLEEVAPPHPRMGKPHIDAQRTAEILEQQAALMEQLRQAQEMQAAAQRRKQFEAEVAGRDVPAVALVRSALGDDLRDAASLRRAFLLREVLGPPAALR